MGTDAVRVHNRMEIHFLRFLCTCALVWVCVSVCVCECVSIKPLTQGIILQLDLFGGKLISHLEML